MKILSNQKLSSLTTIRLGGDAKYLVEANTITELNEAMMFARQSGEKVFILGGGSNVIFADEGFNGLVVRINLKGIEIYENDSDAIVSVAAGEDWDGFVKLTVNKGFRGVECLSGIPGLIGATPMQNVGAYGQEVSDTIVKVNAVSLDDLSKVEFENADCNFGYRSSRFKNEDKGKYIITGVTFLLKKNTGPQTKYPDLEKAVTSDSRYSALISTHEKLMFIREKVLEIRRRKSMVIDSPDPNSVSCGSFFMNPLLNEHEFKSFTEICRQKNLEPKFFWSGEFCKIPAAWLIEQTGFKKGYRFNGVGISDNHSLALININGTSKDLRVLSEQIKQKVLDEFRIMLQNEPEFVE